MNNTKVVSLRLNTKDYKELNKLLNYMVHHYEYTKLLSPFINELIEMSFDGSINPILSLIRENRGEIVKGRTTNKAVGIVMNKEVYDEFVEMNKEVFKLRTVSELIRIFIINGMNLLKESEEI